MLVTQCGGTGNIQLWEFSCSNDDGAGDNYSLVVIHTFNLYEYLARIDVHVDGKPVNVNQSMLRCCEPILDGTKLILVVQHVSVSYVLFMIDIFTREHVVLDSDKDENSYFRVVTSRTSNTFVVMEFYHCSVWDTDTSLIPVARFDLQCLTRPVFSQDNQTLISIQGSKIVGTSILDGSEQFTVVSDTGSETLLLHSRWSWACFSPSYDLLGLAFDNTIRIHETRTWTLQVDIEDDFGFERTSLEFTSNSEILFSCGSRGIRVWSVRDGTRLWGRTHNTGMLLADDRFCAVPGLDGVVSVVHTETGTPVFHWKDGNNKNSKWIMSVHRSPKVILL
jgi:hypothetical protein